MRATLRGVGHHDVYNLPGRIKSFSSRTINPNPDIKLLSKYQAMEGYDGDNGPGEICTDFITERAMELADQYGVGFCTIRHSNHFLASAPYIEKAAEKGYIALCFSRTPPAMGITKKIIGNCPMGFASPTNSEMSIMLDICLAYTSYGKLEEKIRMNEKVPSYWGRDSEGMPTDEPLEIKNGGVPSPIADHKGLGLAMLVEILTGVLSQGQIIDELHPEHEKGVGFYSQSVLVFKGDGLATMDEFKNKTSEMIDRMQAIEPNTSIPGQNSYKNRKKMIQEEHIFLESELVNELNNWARNLGAEFLSLGEELL